MNEVLHANIFFVIASIATVIFCILTCVILYNLLKITKSVRKIVEKVEEGSDMIVEDINSLREAVIQGGFFARILQFIMGLQSSGKRKTRRSKTD
jgi:hypothetical protein